MSATAVEVNGGDVALDLAALDQHRLHIINKCGNNIMV